MRLTDRDYAILLTVHNHDGILSLDQVYRWFFDDRDQRNFRRRLSLLCQHGYLQRATHAQLRTLPEPIVWLTKAGARLVASRQDIPFREFPWRETPRWSKVAHDILLNEFRHTVEIATQAQPEFELEQWDGQDELLRLLRTKVTFRNHRGERQQRLVQPDGMFSLLHYTKQQQTHRLRFLVELDNSTESISRFARDKVYAGIQFVHSPMYQQETDSTTAARFLVVINGPERRFHNMRHDVIRAGGSAYFFFARLADVTPDTALTGAIWHLAHLDRPFSLTEYDTDTFQRFLSNSLLTVPSPKLL